MLAKLGSCVSTDVETTKGRAGIFEIAIQRIQKSPHPNPSPRKAGARGLGRRHFICSRIPVSPGTTVAELLVHSLFEGTSADFLRD